MGGERCLDSAIGQRLSPSTIRRAARLCSGQYSSSTATFTQAPVAQRCHRAASESRLANWVNPLAYTPDPLAAFQRAISDATVYGNTPRNCIIGPPQKNVDFTLDKSFKLGERQDLRFRADFFNLFNHPSFAIPAATTVSPIVTDRRRLRTDHVDRGHAAADSVFVEVFVLGAILI